jgi:hypothetical protein
MVGLVEKKWIQPILPKKISPNSEFAQKMLE